MAKKFTIQICLLLVLGFIFNLQAQGYLYVKAAPSGPQVSTKSATFVEIPDLTLYFYQYYPEHICIGISAEGYCIPEKRMFVRILIDGQPAMPSDVILFNSGFMGTRSFIFTANVTGGLHEVKAVYHIDSGAEAFLGDRTLWVCTAPEFMNVVAAPSGPDISTSSSSFTDISDFKLNLKMPEDGAFCFMLSGEVETSNNKRMFVRALLDGQATEPTDVVLKAGSFYGTDAFTFRTPLLAAGAHTLQMQWLVDAGGTAYMGDRTVAVGYHNPKVINDQLGGIVSISAPSGPQVTTTSGSFTNIPDLKTNFFIPENGSIMIGLTAEAYTSTGKRTFVRATIDGQPAKPSDVVFNASDFSGTHSFNFVAKNLHGGNHQISLEWKVDGGGTAYLGDRNMTLIAFPAPGPDMTSPFNALEPVAGDRPLLVICWDPKRPEHPAPDINDVKNLIFGQPPSVRDYFVANSHNRLHLQDVGMKGWYAAKKNWAHYWAATDPNDSDGDGWTSGHVEKWAEAIREADLTFNYKQFDVNNDGNLTADELGILIVIPQNSPFGTNRIAVGKQYPSEQPLIVDNVKITWIAEVYIGKPLNFGAVAHELCHLFLNSADMYFSFFQPYAAGAYSLMDISYTDAHLDPFHKIRLGWIQPPMILKTGVYPFDAVETSHVAFILHDPAYGNQEYFIIENRYSNLAYDSNLPDQGLAIWHIMEDPDVYGNLTTPTGVDPSNWATVSANDWGRRAIRMIRPVYGPPFDNSKALWDGSDPVTGYDLLSNDANPNHATLRWHDGKPTGFSIRNISPAGQHMEALVEVPWQPVAIEATPTFTMPLEFSLDQNYPNPFNPETTISFFMDENSQVTFKIFNVLGQEVNVLLNQNLSMGRHTIRWDGRDISGTKVPAGVYFYQLKTAKKEAVKKMILIP